MNHFINNKSILLFDGECNFCNSSINFVLKHEKKPELFFSSLQSETGKKILNHFGIKNVESVVLIEENKIYLQSTAALKIAKYLKGAYPLLYGFMIVPPFIRNSIYNYVAKNRYKWFGKRDTCMIPDENLKQRFI